MPPVPWVEQQLNLPGDFNQDGVVDAADYVVWRKGLNTTYVQDDYNTWRTHFGESAQLIVNTGSGTGSFEASSSAAVPEPAAWVLLMFTARRCLCDKTALRSREPHNSLVRGSREQ